MNFIMSIVLGTSFLLATQPASAFLTQDSKPQTASQLTSDERNTIQVFEQSSASVVSVDSTRYAVDFFSMDFQEVPAGSGTGFVWDDQGHIVTNFHVIQGAYQSRSNITVTTKDGKRHTAKIVGVEPAKDIAVLKIKKLEIKSNGFSSRIANSQKLLVGQKVLAIGNPFGFEQTLTTGIVSALNRSMPSVMPQVTIRNMIQTDASINPGNSGGPLIDSQGQLVGMNTSIISRSGSSAGLGFAVPSNTINRMVSQIIKHGKVIQPALGIGLVRPNLMRLLHRYGYHVKKGIVIASVDPASDSARAGLKGMRRLRNGDVKLGDIILKVDQKDVNDYDDLYNILSEKRVGDKVEVLVKRNGKKMKKRIRLQPLSQES
ncbi:MAG: trypsin-like peptidase domain-containing protein [Pseudomonadota bacterium]